MKTAKFKATVKRHSDFMGGSWRIVSTNKKLGKLENEKVMVKVRELNEDEKAK